MNERENMKWWIWLAVFFATIAAVAAAVFVFQTRVDPMGVWESETIDGFNQFKSAQFRRDALFKTYQFAARKPDVVILGNSTAAFGIPARSVGEQKRMYNLGFQAAWIVELQILAHFVIRTHRPEKIVLVLNPLLLSNGSGEGMIDRGPLFMERLRAISYGDLTANLFKLRETVFSADALRLSKDVIEVSRANKGSRPLYVDGWARCNGEGIRVAPAQYLETMWRYHTVANRSLVANPGSIAVLKRIVKSVRRRGVELVVIFDAVSADFQASFDVNGQYGLFEEMKRSISKITPYWDFSDINSVTVNRNRFMDALHYRGTVGTHMIARVNDATQYAPADFGVYVTRENVDTHLATSREKFVQWKNNNMDFYNLLVECREPAHQADFNRRVPAFWNR